MPIYMNYDGIKGDVTEGGHKEWILLESCQLGVHRSIRSAAGRGANREASAPSVNEIVVTKQQDCASTELFKASLWGEGKKVKIDFCKTDDKKIEVFMNVELENTLVSSYSSSGHGGGDRPMESLSLNFTKITFVTTAMDEKNATAKPQRAMWDLTQLKGS
jgi:type VI secretion system secreted protein Hcp